jgi:hypothetical protein
MPFKKIDDGSNPIDEDTEGNAMKPRGLDDGSEVDTEGHVSAQQQPGKPFARRALDDGSGDDDTAGHAASRKF